MKCNIVSDVSEHIEKILDDFLRTELKKLYPDQDFSDSNLQKLKDEIRRDNLTLGRMVGIGLNAEEYILYRDEKEVSRIRVNYKVMQMTKYPFVFLKDMSV